MKQVTMIGLDLAKAVFQVHGVDQSGVVTLRRSRGLRHPQRDLDPGKRGGLVQPLPLHLIEEMRQGT
jgi:hypothetical protein